VLPIGGTILGSEIGGSATLDGVANLVSPNTLPFADGVVLNISGFYPVPPIGGATGAVLTGPFSLSGEFIRGCGFGFGFKTCVGVPFDDVSFFLLEGQGVYTLELQLVHDQFRGDGWQWTSVRFDLQPTPEPATLLLFGTSATAGLGVVRWRRRVREYKPYWN
jgi:hypothetical protein